MAFSGNGAGTSGDPYQITTLAQLYEIFDNLTSHFILMNDIDASDTSSGLNTQPWNGPSGWYPVQNSTFTGSLNGGGFSINGLYHQFGQTGPADNNRGFFYNLNGYVHNITINWTLAGLANGFKFGGLAYFYSGASPLGPTRYVNQSVTINTIANVTNPTNVSSSISNFYGSIFSTNVLQDEFVFKNCKSRLVVNILSNAYLQYVAGFISRAGCTNIRFEECHSTLKIVGSNDDTPGLCRDVAGYCSQGSLASYPSDPANKSHSYYRCSANIFANTTNVGIYGFHKLGSVPAGVLTFEECWVTGYIRANRDMASFTDAEFSNLKINKCWSSLSMTMSSSSSSRAMAGFVGKSNYTGSIHASALISNSYFSGTLVATVPITDDPNTKVGIIGIHDYPTTNVYHNTDTLQVDSPYLIVGDSVELDSDQMLVSSNYTGFDFVNSWEMGGYSGFADIINNVYNPLDSEFMPPPLYIANPLFETLGSGSSRIYSNLNIIGGDLSNVDEVYIEYGVNSGAYENSILVPKASISHTITNLDEWTTYFARIRLVLVDTNTILSNERKFIHFDNEQLPVQIITPEATVTPVNQDTIHGSLIVNVQGTEYFFGTPRVSQVANTTDINRNQIFKCNTQDYNDISYVELVDSESRRCSQFNQIVYAGGYLWTVGETFYKYNATPVLKYLFRIDPVTLDWVAFHGSGVDYSTDSHGTDGIHLFLGALNVFKIDVSQLTGIYPSGSHHVLPLGSVIATYDHTSQGFHLESIVPGWTASIKGEIHSYLTDGAYVYAEYTSGGGVRPTGFENEARHELHKIRISDMTPAGYCRIPKATDDATQNSEFVFLGVEQPTSYPIEGALGHRWGAAAVRKSDMQLFAIPSLHSADNELSVSYASTIFGNYLVDCKANSNLVFIVDITNIATNWHLVDSLQLYPNYNLGTKKVGERTIGVFAIGSLSQVDSYTYIGGAPPINEIHYDSNGKFHATRWAAAGVSASPSPLIRFNIPGLSFIASPLIQTTSAVVTVDSVLLSGFIITPNGAEVTSVGFEVTPDGGNPTSYPANLSNNFELSLSDLTPGAYTVRAYGVNSEGTGYGNLINFNIELSVSTPTVTTSSSSVNDTSVTLSGSVSNDGGEAPISSGFYYGTDSQNLNLSTSNDGTLPAISKVLNELAPGTYYFRAFAQNSAGTGLGSVLSFTIESDPDPTPGLPEGTVSYNGSVVQGATVIAIDRSNLSLNYTTVTDVNGGYSFVGVLPAGEYYVFTIYEDLNVTRRSTVKIITVN